MTKQLGPTFGDEVIAAGLGGKPFSWGATDDSITGRENLDAADNATLDDVVAAHDPTDKRPNIVSTWEFVSRFTNQEYIALMRHRADQLAQSKIGHSKSWDIVTSDDTVDLSKTRCINLKQDLVSDGLLTQARADVIFDTPAA